MLVSAAKVTGMQGRCGDSCHGINEVLRAGRSEERKTKSRTYLSACRGWETGRRRRQADGQWSMDDGWQREWTINKWSEIVSAGVGDGVGIGGAAESG